MHVLMKRPYASPQNAHYPIQTQTLPTRGQLPRLPPALAKALGPLWWGTKGQPHSGHHDGLGYCGASSVTLHSPKVCRAGTETRQGHRGKEVKNLRENKR